MKTLVLIFLSAFMLFSCSDRNSHCIVDQSAISLNDSILALKDTKEEINRILKFVKESPLDSCECTNAYRLIVFYSFDIEYCIYEFIKKPYGVDVSIIKTYEEYFKAQNNINDTSYIKRISSTEWQELETLMVETCYWGMKPYNNRIGFDGRSYILEGYNNQGNEITNRNYHVVGRWSPNDSTDFRKIINAIESHGLGG